MNLTEREETSLNDKIPRHRLSLDLNVSIYNAKLHLQLSPKPRLILINWSFMLLVISKANSKDAYFLHLVSQPITFDSRSHYIFDILILGVLSPI